MARLDGHLDVDFCSSLFDAFLYEMHVRYTAMRTFLL